MIFLYDPTQEDRLIKFFLFWLRNSRLIYPRLFKFRHCFVVASRMRFYFFKADFFLLVEQRFDFLFLLFLLLFYFSPAFF